MFVTISEVIPKNSKLYKELFDKKEFKESERIFKIVKKNVEKLKEFIPFL
jgi:hypothetical protein